MFYRISILLLFSFFNPAFSQWKKLSSNLDTVGITAIYVSDSIWLAGELNKDVLWFSIDKGKSWKTNDTKAINMAYGYKTIVNNNGRVVAGGRDGDRGFWCTYNDSGRRRVARGSSSEVRYIIAYPNKEWLRIEFQDIVRSGDDGLLWRSEGLKNTTGFPDTVIEKDGIIYVGTYQKATFSIDEGKTFQPYDIPTVNASLQNIAICNDRIVAVFSKSTTDNKDLKIYSSSLGTKPTWTLESDLTSKNFQEIWQLWGFQNHLFAIASDSPPTNLLYSKDLGKTLSPISYGLDKTIYPLFVQVFGDTVLLGTTRGIYWTRLSEIEKSVVLSTENKIESNVLVYPNPTENDLTIETLDNIVEIEVFDLKGSLQKSKLQKIAENKYRMNTENLSTGLYLIQIKTKSQSYTRRFFRK